MESARKNLKILSILLLALSIVSLGRMALQLAFPSFNIDSSSLNISEGMILAAQIILTVISFLFLIPQIYVGVKGLKISKDTDNFSNAVVVWAIILAVISFTGILSSLSNITQGKDIVGSVIETVDMSLDVIIYIFFIKYVKQSVKAA